MLYEYGYYIFATAANERSKKKRKMNMTLVKKGPCTRGSYSPFGAPRQQQQLQRRQRQRRLR